MERGVLFVALSALAFAGCSTAKQVGRQALRTTPQGRKYLSQWDRYSRIASTLKKYHDSGVLDQGDVLDILYGEGILKQAPPPRKGRTPPKRKSEPKPFPVPVYKGAWRWPLDAGIVSSEYGPRWGKMHHGLDIAADSQTPLHASAPGEVVYADNKLSGYGNVVILRHDEKTTSLYAHNKALKVTVGQKVARGQVVALLGSTGRSTGPHVHYEIRGGKGTVDPRKILPKSKF